MHLVVHAKQKDLFRVDVGVSRTAFIIVLNLSSRVVSMSGYCPANNDAKDPEKIVTIVTKTITALCIRRPAFNLNN